MTNPIDITGQRFGRLTAIVLLLRNPAVNGLALLQWWPLMRFRAGVGIRVTQPVTRPPWSMAKTLHQPKNFCRSTLGVLRAAGPETDRTRRLPLALRGRPLDRDKRLTPKTA